MNTGLVGLLTAFSRCQPQIVIALIANQFSAVLPTPILHCILATSFTEDLKLSVITTSVFFQLEIHQKPFGGQDQLGELTVLPQSP